MPPCSHFCVFCQMEVEDVWNIHAQYVQATLYLLPPSPLPSFSPLIPLYSCMIVPTCDPWGEGQHLEGGEMSHQGTSNSCNYPLRATRGDRSLASQRTGRLDTCSAACRVTFTRRKIKQWPCLLRQSVLTRSFLWDTIGPTFPTFPARLRSIYGAKIKRQPPWVLWYGRDGGHASNSNKSREIVATWFNARLWFGLNNRVVPLQNV